LRRSHGRPRRVKRFHDGIPAAYVANRNRLGSTRRIGVSLDMTIRRLTTDDIEVYREVRLRALASDPGAFGSNHDRESAFTHADWAERLAGFRGHPGAIFVCEHDGRVDGVVGVGLSEVDTDATLWGMWVDATARGSGVARDLVDATIGWARDQRLSAVMLWVRRANTRATAFYERCGFVDASDWAGEQPPECAEERCMRATIYAASP